MAKTVKKTIQYRNSNLTGLNAVDENEVMKVSGHAAVFEKPTVIAEINGIEFKEVIDRNAFDNADISDCCLKYNHSDHIPILARVRSGNLKLTTDNIGLRFEAELFNTSSARDVYSLLKEGGLTECSFAFTVKEEAFDYETNTRKILKIEKLFDVSIVDFPAYDGTDVSAREYFSAEAEKIIALEKETQLKRKRAILKIKLS